MARTLQEIPPLLHDARLCDLRWDHHLKTLILCFQCLRRNVDGTDIEDSTVDLKLSGVERISAHYSPASVNLKPSEFEACSRITVTDLEGWPHGAVEAYLSINSAQADFEAITACVRETLVGVLTDKVSESTLRIQVSFEPHNYGPQGTFTDLSIDCDLLETFSNAVPLDIETWERQYEAWWTGWRHYWSKKDKDGLKKPALAWWKGWWSYWSKKDENGFKKPAIEDTLIPAGRPDPPDLSYRPPVAAPFLLSSTTAPAELIKPIEDYHDGHHEQNWLKMASAYPFFDQEPSERAASLRDQFLGYNFGKWVYVRYIDAWWCEGNRACVIVRGIEHDKGHRDSPARNEETVITYGLRRIHQTWVIATWTQAWPRFGSADKLQNAQSWRDGWNLAE